VRELAKAVGCSPDMTSKHLAVLRKAGAVVQSADGFTRFQNNIYPCPANPLWTSAIASSGWMRWSKLENILESQGIKVCRRNIKSLSIASSL